MKRLFFEARRKPTIRPWESFTTRYKYLPGYCSDCLIFLRRVAIVDGFKNCQNYSEKEILKVIKYIDVMKVGYIEYEEFLRACISKTDFLTDENLKVSFYLFTKDENKK